MPYDPTNPNVMLRNGTPFVRRPRPIDPADPFADQADPNDVIDYQLGSDGQTWEPGSYAHEGGQAGKVLGLAMLAGAGGGLAQAYLPALLAGGGVPGGAAGAATSGAGGAGAGGAAAGAGAATGAAGGAGAAVGTAGGTGGGMFGLSIPGLGGKIGLMDLISIGGDVLGTMGDSRAKGRAAQANYNLDYDEAERRRIETLNQQALADVAQRKYADEANLAAQQQRRAANFMRAPNAHTDRPEGVEDLASNFGPEMVPNRDAMADDLERQAMIRILNPIKAGTGNDTLPTLPALEELSRTDLEPGALDDIFNWAGLIGGGAAAVNQIGRRGPTTTPAPMTAGRVVPSYLTDPRGGYQLPDAPITMPTVRGGVPSTLFNADTSTRLPYIPPQTAAEYFAQLGLAPTQRRPAVQPSNRSSGTTGRSMLPAF